MNAVLKDPVRYDPTLEEREENERDVQNGLAEEMRAILDKTSEDYGHAVRSVHAKSHAIIAGRLTIAPDLPKELAQGIFARPGTHDVVMRFSTNPGDVLHDGVSVPRGLAIKVVDVEGERLPHDAESRNQDFVMINGPVFSADNAHKFLMTLKGLRATTDRLEWAKRGLSSVLQKVNEAVGGNATLQTLGGAPNTHVLGDTYFTQTAYRYGDHIAKLQLVPVSNHLRALEDSKVDTKDRPDALREEADKVLSAAGGTWEIRVQLCRDTDSMPIEDPSVLWSEEESPFRTVATIEAAPQPAWSEARRAEVDDRMSFSPWHGIVAHRPMGRINRVRAGLYDMSAHYRAEFNRCPMTEPTAPVSLPG